MSKTEVGVTGHDVILSMVFFDRLDLPAWISRGLLGHLSCEIGVLGGFYIFLNGGFWPKNGSGKHIFITLSYSLNNSKIFFFYEVFAFGALFLR